MGVLVMSSEAVVLPVRHVNKASLGDVPAAPYEEPGPEPDESVTLPWHVGETSVAESSEIQTTAESLELLRDEAEKSGFQAGYEKGYEQGTAEGLAAAELCFNERISVLTELCTALEARLASDADDIERTALQVVLSVLTGMLGETLVHEEGVLAAVRQVLIRVHDDGVLKVRVSPSDYKILTTADQAFASAGYRVEWLADASVKIGGCVVASPRGIWDGSIESQLKMAMQTLMQTVGER